MRRLHPNGAGVFSRLGAATEHDLDNVQLLGFVVSRLHLKGGRITSGICDFKFLIVSCPQQYGPPSLLSSLHRPKVRVLGTRLNHIHTAQPNWDLHPLELPIAARDHTLANKTIGTLPHPLGRFEPQRGPPFDLPDGSKWRVER